MDYKCKMCGGPVHVERANSEWDSVAYCEWCGSWAEGDGDAPLIIMTQVLSRHPKATGHPKCETCGYRDKRYKAAEGYCKRHGIGVRMSEGYCNAHTALRGEEE